MLTASSCVVVVCLGVAGPLRYYMSKGPEVRPAPWALSNLENAKFPKERCAATIADLVLFVDGGTREHGGVGGERWLFTPTEAAGQRRIFIKYPDENRACKGLWDLYI